MSRGDFRQIAAETLAYVAEGQYRGSQGIHILRNENPVALNFASGRNPGGGFENGAQAQEESLARSSALYATLTTEQAHPYYEANRQVKSGYYTDHIIYSPRCPVLRANDGTLLPPVLCSFITAPAVNCGVARKHAGEEKVRAVMRERAAKVLRIAAANGHECVVLGSWGTGVFRNPVKAVANMFRELLFGPFDGVFRLVRFSILDEPTFLQFVEVFQGNAGVAAVPIRPPARPASVQPRPPKTGNKRGIPYLTLQNGSRLDRVESLEAPFEAAPISRLRFFAS